MKSSQKLLHSPYNSLHKVITEHRLMDTVDNGMDNMKVAMKVNMLKVYSTACL